ncbi:MAG: hypothetical protein IJM30_12820 [Thermoguttaceae bacterium]|nr:hypothetical protein [Thermoguttaceae bacterium]
MPDDSSKKTRSTIGAFFKIGFWIFYYAMVIVGTTTLALLGALAFFRYR